MPHPNDFIGFLQKDKNKGEENEINGDAMSKLHRYWVLAGLRQSKENLQKDYDKKDNNYQEYKRQINYLRIQIIKHYLKNTFLFPIWFIKILAPSFLKGTPNIWTNLKLIIKNKEFHPLRMAMLSWFAFSYLLIQGGMFYFKHAPPVSAATFTWVQTDWSGNPDGGATATHTDNRTGWTKYSSLSNTYVSSTGQINLATSTYSITDGTTFSTTGDDTGGDFDSGTNSNTMIWGGNVQLASTTAGDNAWAALSAVPGNVSYGAQMLRNGADDTIYLARGAETTGFYSYSISGNTWTTLAVVPGTVYYGARMIRNSSDNTIYLARGNGSTGFYSYSISGNTWTTLAVVPGTVGYAPQMLRNGADDTIYLARGDNSTGFYSYSISGNTWTTLAAVPGAVYAGPQMIRNGADNTIYLVRGGSPASTSFYSYSISANTWTTLETVPGAVDYGAQMIRNSSDNTIYLVRGGWSPGTTGFYSYSISGNTWTTLAAVPGAVGRGAQMIRNGADDTIYLAAGNVATGFYSYSISGNTWTTLVVVPDAVGIGARMIRNSSDNTIYLTRGNASTGFYRYQIISTTYASSGTFTSASIDVGSNDYGNLSFTSSTVGVGTLPVRLQIATNNDNSTWNYVGPDGTASTYFTNDAGAAIDVGNDATRYLKYKILLQTSDTTNTPEVSAVTLGYTGYRPSGTLTSSAFDSTSEANLMSKISWTETLNTGDIKFQLRTASTAGGLTAAAFVGPDGTASSYFTSSTGGESMPSAFTTGGNDQFFQYQATVTTTNGAVTPVLSDVTVNYVVNAIPEISGSGVTATQNANGTVTIVYAAYDPDGTVALGDGDGLATPSFQYSLNGTSTSTIVSGLTESGYASATTTHAIGSGWVTSTVIWTPKNEIDGNYTARAWIKVIVNDGEAANSTVSSTSPSFALDVKNPTMGSPSMVVIATTTPATLRLSASDDNSMQMAISLNSDMAGATWQTYATTSTITVDTSPDTVYAQFRDSFANTSTIQSVSTPVTPTNMVIRDISNINTADYKEFVAWAVVALPTPGFSRYDLYKSTGGGAYALLTSITDRAVNYYVDTVSANITYAYKIAAVDSNGNASQFSSIVSDNADGQGGTDQTAPTITNVTTSNITTQGFTVTWDTDEISSSSVAYSATTFGPTFTTTTVHTMTHSSSGVLGAHSVTLSGLTPGVEYFFQVASADPIGNIVYKNNDGSGYSATTLEGATISGTAVDSVDNTQATITWNSSASADSTVYYSTSATMAGASNVTSATLTTVHSLNITGLTQGTRYYFYVTSGNATDNNAGAYYTFTTTADTVAPTISSISASPVADTTAVITWVTNEGATTQINYGTTSGSLTSYSTPATGLNLNHTVSLTGLTVATKYYYTVASLDGSGNPTTSTENNFTTLQTLSEEAAVVAREATATAAGTAAGTEAAGGGGGFPFTPTDNIPPVISNVKTSKTTSETATIEWTTNEAGDSIVEFGKNEKYTGAAVNLSNLLIMHSVKLEDLKPSVKYSYRVSTADKSGNRAFSGNQTFLTISGFEEINTLQELGSQGTPEEGSPEAIFTDLIGKTADIIRRMSGQVSLQTLETGLATQYATIRELGRLVPLPLIGGQPVVEVGGTYARIFWTTDKPASSLVAVAPDSTYTNNQEYTQVIGDASTLVENHEVLLSELKPNTLYHYQVRSKTPVSDTAKSRDFTFKTKEEQIEIITYKIDKTSDTEALFSWTTNVPTDSKVTYIPYGSDGKILIDSLKSVYDKNVVTSHNVTVKDLEGGPTYQIELAGEDAGGNIVSKTISTFSTSEIDAPPVITQVQTDSALIPGAQVAVQAIISWITNEPATSQIFYQRGFGKTNEKKEFTQKTALDPNYIKRHIMVITNFDSGAVYQFQVESMDSSGNTTRSKTYTILTPRQKESVFQVIMGSMEETFSWVGKVGL